MHVVSRLLVVIVTFVFALAAVAQSAPERASGWSDRRPVTSRTFMIAAANPLGQRDSQGLAFRDRSGHR